MVSFTDYQNPHHTPYERSMHVDSDGCAYVSPQSGPAPRHGSANNNNDILRVKSEGAVTNFNTSNQAAEGRVPRAWIGLRESPIHILPRNLSISCFLPHVSYLPYASNKSVHATIHIRHLLATLRVRSYLPGAGELPT